MITIIVHAITAFLLTNFTNFKQYLHLSTFSSCFLFISEYVINTTLIPVIIKVIPKIHLVKLGMYFPNVHIKYIPAPKMKSAKTFLVVRLFLYENINPITLYANKQMIIFGKDLLTYAVGVNHGRKT